MVNSQYLESRGGFPNEAMTPNFCRVVVHFPSVKSCEKAKELIKKLKKNHFLREKKLIKIRQINNSNLPEYCFLIVRSVLLMDLCKIVAVEHFC